MKTLATLLLLLGGAATVAAEPKFEPQTLDDKLAIGYGLAIGEVNGDKHPDILVADKKQFVWYKNPGRPGQAWAKFVMAENLTARDNVCIAARDINGDGKVEVAVGAMWNPGETSDPKKSGSVHYLVRPKDPTAKWEAIQLPHEPTVHRMRWVQVADNRHDLVVLPLHGRGNRGGAGDGVRVLAYRMPANPHDPWETTVLDQSMHMTHNFDILEATRPDGEKLRGVLLGGKEGVRAVMIDDGQWREGSKPNPAFTRAAGEVRGLPATTSEGLHYITTIEPMHGNSVVLYSGRDGQDTATRHVLDEDLKQGHALALADVLGAGRPQVIAGWRNPNRKGRVGIRLYELLDAAGSKWNTHVLDDNRMACEDLKIADLDGDGRLDVIACGRATKNLVVYWNRTEVPAAR